MKKALLTLFFFSSFGVIFGQLQHEFSLGAGAMFLILPEVEGINLKPDHERLIVGYDIGYRIEKNEYKIGLHYGWIDYPRAYTSEENKPVHLLDVHLKFRRYLGTHWSTDLGLIYGTGIYNGLHSSLISQGESLHQLGALFGINYHFDTRWSLYLRGEYAGLQRSEEDEWWRSVMLSFGGGYRF